MTDNPYEPPQSESRAAELARQDARTFRIYFRQLFIAFAWIDGLVIGIILGAALIQALAGNDGDRLYENLLNGIKVGLGGLVLSAAFALIGSWLIAPTQDRDVV